MNQGFSGGPTSADSVKPFKLSFQEKPFLPITIEAMMAASDISNGEEEKVYEWTKK